MATLNRIVPCLWFDTQAEEAARYYVSIFKKNSEIGTITHYGKEGFEIHKKPEGSVLTVTFYLQGQEFTALNGGSLFKFNEATSFEVRCENQAEVDYYWEKLGEGGEHGPCGWLKDRFGLSWQVVPAGMDEVFADDDPERAQRAMQAMLQMSKLDIAELKAAADGEPAR